MEIPLRFVHALQALAIDAESQLSLYPQFVVKADELVLDFDNWYGVAKPDLEAEATLEAKRSLQALDEFIDSISGQPFAHLWTEEAVLSSEEWKKMRLLAQAACNALGVPIETPPSSPDIFVQGS